MNGTILVYAHRDETTDHPTDRDWVEDTINSGGAYGVSALVRSGFMRAATPLKVFECPTPLGVALEVVKQIRGQPHAVALKPRLRPWAIFGKLLCTK